MKKFTINGMEANYNNLFIYDGETIVFQTSRCYDFNLHLENIEIRNARKLNFKKNDVFEIKTSGDSYLWRNGKDLYIPISIISIDSKKEVLSLDANGEKTFIYEYIFSLHCTAYTYNRHYEKITNFPSDRPLKELDANGRWGDGWSYECAMYNHFENPRTGESGLCKKWITRDLATSYTASADYIHRSEKTQEREEREKIASIISDCLYSNKHISHFEVERIMEKLNITIK